MGRKIATKNHEVWDRIKRIYYAKSRAIKDLQLSVVGAKAIEWLKQHCPELCDSYVEARKIADQIKTMYDEAPAEIQNMLSLSCHNVGRSGNSLQLYVPAVIYGKIEQEVNEAQFKTRWEALENAHRHALDQIGLAETRDELDRIVNEFSAI